MNETVIKVISDGVLMVDRNITDLEIIKNYCSQLDKSLLFVPAVNIIIFIVYLFLNKRYNLNKYFVDVSFFISFVTNVFLLCVLIIQRFY